MQRVRGIGGVFFKTDDPEAITAWYAKHLGMPVEEHGSQLMWRDHEDPERVERTVWGPFPRDTEYFGPADTDVMVNYIVDDLDAMLDQLRDAGVTVEDDVEQYPYGRFGWCYDPDGRRLELWQPPDDTTP